MVCLFWDRSVAFLECGIGNEVLDVLTQFVGGSSQEIQVISLCKPFKKLEEKIIVGCLIFFFQGDN